MPAVPDMHSIIVSVAEALRASGAGASSAPVKARQSTISFRDLAWLLPFVKPHWRLCAVAVTVALINTVAALWLPFTFKALADGVARGADYDGVDRVVWMIVGAIVVLALADFVKQWHFVRFQQRVILAVQHNLFHRVLRLPKEFFDGHRTGYLMSRVVGDAMELRAFLSLDLVNVPMKVLQFVVALSILVYLNWQLTVLSLAILPLFVLVTRVFSARLRRLNRAALERSAVVSQELEETLSAAALIKSFGAEDRETQKIAASLGQAADAHLTRTTIGALFGLLAGVVNAVGLGGVLWYGARQIVADRLTIGELLAFSAYLGLLIEPAKFLVGLNVTLQQAFAALERVLEFMRMIPEGDGEQDRLQVARLEGHVRFEDVSFAYDGSHVALDRVSFAVGPRQLIAVVGASGAGKSTLINLIIGLYQCTTGRVSFDDRAAQRIDHRSLRDRIGLVSQETVLFDDSVANNIRYGRPDRSHDEVIAVARRIGAHDFIAALPDGYETRVGENGVKLSVGQKQRISIARALLKDPDIFIFDEITSALDAQTERIIQRLLAELRRTKTVFVVAHRFGTVVQSDIILVLENGRLVQQGTHQELIQQRGVYRQLCPTEFGAAMRMDVVADDAAKEVTDSQYVLASEV